MTPKKVILTCNYSPWSRYSGGAQKSVHMIALEMVNQGMPVAVVYSKAPWEKVSVPNGLPYKIHWAGFFAFKSGISSPLRFLNGIAFYFKVRSLSDSETILHGNGDEASLLGLIHNRVGFIYTNRYPKFPKFLTGADWSRPMTWLRIFLREPRFVAMAMGMRGADLVTVTSDFSLTEISRCFGITGSGAKVVPNGVDPDFLEMPLDSDWEKPSRKGEQPRGDASQPSKTRNGVLFYGRLTHAKGPDLVLDAYALLPAATRIQHPLLIIGKGPLRTQLDNRVRDLGLKSVSFLDWKFGADLAREILARRVICLPSREESFGNTVVEALALGQTVVSSRAGSIPEVAGPWGTLVEGEKPEALAAALGLALERERPLAERLAQRAYIEAKFGWASTVRRFREIYDMSSPPVQSPS